MNGSNPRQVSVIGAGSWGTALAHLLADAGAEVTLWGRDPAVISDINTRHQNRKYLADCLLNEKVKGSTDLASALSKASVIVCSVPTQQIRQVFAPYAAKLSGKTVINTAKGMELGTFCRVSEIFSELAPSAKYAVLSGPSFAEEVARRLPTAVTVAATELAVAEQVQQSLATSYFRAYSSQDVIGVELAGSLKNVVAIGSGVVAGLKLGYNAQAAIINRGIAEMTRMGKKLGAEPLTFMGLAGMGDLILTCTGPLSRNRRLGIALGEGKTLNEAQHAVGGVAEGVFTARAAEEFARKLGIEMPITEQVHRILYQGTTPQQALAELMSRDLKAEW